uniref:glycogenin glucosyltransferase n=2 Tax=Sinocyclocheilus anshuiensis TaxID=1608454 RepID=A0A671SWH4_9TELE
MVLGKSLRNHNTLRKLVALIGPHVLEPSRAVLRKVYDEVRLVDVLDSGDAAHLAMMKRPDLGVTFTKLHGWTLTEYSKCVFMDADTLVLSNIDELFEREELSAAPDPGWPDCFNSGVFVFHPSNETYGKLLTTCSENGSFDGGDQGILNSFFSDWATADISKHLPFIYNLSSIAIYTYLPAFKQYGHDAKVVHFLGKVKPWDYSYDTTSKTLKGQSQDASDMHPNFLLQWWELFSSSVLPLMKEEYGDQPFHSGCTEFRITWDIAAYTDTTIVRNAVVLGKNLFLDDFPSTDMVHSDIHVDVAQMHMSHHPPPPQMSSQERKQKWEHGQADYMGLDSFENIEKKLDSFLK